MKLIKAKGGWVTPVSETSRGGCDGCAFQGSPAEDCPADTRGYMLCAKAPPSIYVRVDPLYMALLEAEELS